MVELNASSLIVDFFFGEIEKRIESILSTAGFETRQTIIEAANAVRALITNARAAYEDSLNKTVAEVNRTLQETLAEVESLTSEIEDLAQGVTSDVENIVNRARAGIDSLRSNVPRIYSYSPKAIVGHRDSDTDKPVPIRIVGANLKQKQVKLFLSGNECKLISEGEDELVFEASKAFFPDPDPNPTDNQLVPFRSTTLQLEIIQDKIFPLPDKKEVFPLGIYIYPSVFGIFKCSVTLRESIPQPPIIEDRTTGTFSCEGSNTTRRNCRFPVTIDGAGHGWTLVPTSLKFNKTFGTRGGDFHGFEAITDTGFVVKLSGGARTPRIGGVRGRIRGTVSYQRQKLQPDETRNRKEDKQEGFLVWGNDISIDFDQNTDTFELTVQLFNGNSPIFNPQNLNNDYLKVDYDKVNKSILIQPITEEEIEIF